MVFSLSDKVVVIIGGTAGLGFAGAKAIIRHGGRVVVVGRSTDSLSAALKVLGDEARGLAGDAAHPETSAAAVSLAREEFGAVHGLYHVAGGSGRKQGDGPLHEVADSAVPFTLGINLHSIIYSNRAAVRAFLEQGTGGVILNMGSVLGYSPSPRYFATHVYAAAKAGIIGFTKSVASCYAKKSIRANVIAPALVETPMARRAAEDEVIQSFIATKQPLDGGRIGCPEDCDGAVVYLLSDASKFCTGQVLAVDGGWTVSEGQFQDE